MRIIHRDGGLITRMFKGNNMCIPLSVLLCMTQNLQWVHFESYNEGGRRQNDDEYEQMTSREVKIG